MKTTRREFAIGTAATAAASAFSFPRPAIAQTEPIRIGWLAALTGASSAPAIGFDRGVRYAAETINAAGGVKGRKIEVITRDTQGDPTKAVNATQEMISQLKVHAVWGPTNSGESLAITPIMARAKMPNIHPCVIDSLIDPEKFPNAFRTSPSNTQWNDAVRTYCIKILKVKKVAVIADTTGYGVAAAKYSTRGAEEGRRRRCLCCQYRRDPARHDAGHAAREERWRRSDRGVEHLDRHGCAHVQYARHHGLGRSFRRTSLDVVGRYQEPARQAGELGKGLCRRISQLQL